MNFTSQYRYLSGMEKVGVDVPQRNKKMLAARYVVGMIN